MKLGKKITVAATLTIFSISYVNAEMAVQQQQSKSVKPAPTKASAINPLGKNNWSKIKDLFL